MSLSTRTLTAPTTFSTTEKDMTSLFKWAIGDAEPEGSHALANAAHARLRRDHERGKASAKSYSSNTVYINTFERVGKQLPI